MTPRSLLSPSYSFPKAHLDGVVGKAEGKLGEDVLPASWCIRKGPHLVLAAYHLRSRYTIVSKCVKAMTYSEAYN